MRVALVYPEVYDLARFKEKRKEFPPFGVMYLAAVAEQAGHEVSVFAVTDEHWTLDLRCFEAVGFSIPSSATYGVIKQARIDSLYADDPLIMVGGVHPSFYPERTLIDIAPHVVGIGEGEATLLDLLDEVTSRRFDRVTGVCHMHNGEPVRTRPRTLMRDIDVLPLPARHLLNPDDFVMSDRVSTTDLRMAHVMFSRGCPFPCRFCAAAQTRIQYRSGASARHELEHLVSSYSIDGFAIVDDNFVVNKQKVRDICTAIEDLGLQWSALSRVDTVDRALLEAMATSGCIEVKFGMESGSEAILEAMRKDTKQEQIRSAVRMARQVGIKVKVFLVHGYPGENLETTRATMRLLNELAPDIERVSLLRFVPLPGTYVYEHPDEFDLHHTDRDADWDGDWRRYHIHHNHEHWWGTTEDFAVVQQGYEMLRGMVDALWPERLVLPTLPTAG
ncbi:radical SAM protein [Streptomyces sp. NPDC046909]|uniref:B12-binding domain-containing radical SAM protein n=1 Tax=Streptomyces sp. NPDC046909 TaxID=3155617 RepID=UPI003405B605